MADELFKVIFQLEGDATGILKSLDEVNSKYKDSSREFDRQKIALQTLLDRETALTAARAKANNPTAIAKLNAELEKNKVKIEACEQAVDQLSGSEQKASKTTDDLNKKIKDAFDGTKISAANTEVQKIAKSIDEAQKPTQSLRAQLKELKAQLASTDDDEEFKRLTIEAGKLQDKINDVNEATNVFATGSKLESFGRSFRGVLGDLVNLDFEGASQKARVLANISKSITFKETLTGIKDLGSTLFSIGKALLRNPIFLIGAAVTTIIANFDTLRNSGGLVGKVFTSIGNIVNGVIKIFTDLTDAIGLTDIASQKASKSIQEQFLKTNDIAIQAVNNRYNAEIAIARAAGKELSDLEIKKRQELIKTYESGIKAQFDLVDGTNASIAKALAFEKQSSIQIKTLRREIELIRIEEATKAAEKLKEIREQEAQDAQEIIDKWTEEQGRAIEEGKRQREEEASEAERLMQEWTKEQDKQIDQRTQQRQDEADEALRILGEWTEAEDKIQDERIARDEADRKQRVAQEKAAIQDIVSTAISASQQVVSAEKSKIDRLTNLQQKRVDDAKALAEKGNAELYELEQKRLDDLNRQRERFVARQQALATVELIANTAIAVSKAAAQGGVAAAITIAAALIALTGGLIAGRSIASQAAYYEGGYTGDGDPRSESLEIGPKPYKYHKGEFVFNHQKTGRYKDIFQDIHEGHIDLLDWKNKVHAYEAMKLLPNGSNVDVSGLQKELIALRMAVEGQYTSLNFDENGLSARFKNIRSRQEYIRKGIARA